MEKINRKKEVLDKGILIIHISYVILMFLLVAYTPFYVSIFFLIPQIIQDIFYNDCILSELQRTYGFANEGEDCFHYLFRQLKMDVSTKITSALNHVIHLIILIVFIYKVYLFFV